MSRTRIDFFRMGEIKVKGKENMIEIWTPTVEMSVASVSTFLTEKDEILPDDILFASRRSRSRSIRKKGKKNGDQGEDNRKNSRIVSFRHSLGEDSPVAASTKEIEQTIAALEHWRKHVQTYAGSHSSLARRTESMMMSQSMSSSPLVNGGTEEVLASSSSINPFFLNEEKTGEGVGQNREKQPVDVIVKRQIFSMISEIMMLLW